MTKDDIIKLARGAGWTNYDSQDERFERFAAIVAAAERDRMCEQFNISKELAHEKTKGNEAN